jgi:hypothetical protein
MSTTIDFKVIGVSSPGGEVCELRLIFLAHFVTCLVHQEIIKFDTAKGDSDSYVDARRSFNAFCNEVTVMCILPHADQLMVR